MSKRWQVWEDALLRTEYSGANAESLLEKLPERNLTTIYARAYTLGITKRNRYSHYIDYFARPDIENSYWAGFIAADGNITQKKDCLTVFILQKDIAHLESLASSLQFTGKIKVVSEYSVNPMARLSISGAQKLIYDLEQNYNITPRKTFTLQPPNLTNPDLIKAFIVGYIDGDGCISLWNDSGIVRPKLSFVGNHAVAHWIAAFINNYLGLSDSARLHKKENIYQYSISSNVALRAIEFLSTVDVPRLERKWGKVQGYGTKI